jgi:membrane protein implicated in regulation of membrane protease activity
VSSWLVWFVAAIAFAVGEMITTTLFVGPFSVGALAAMVVALAGGGGALEVVAFLVLSAAAFTIVRPIAARHRHSPPSIRTGTAALVGRNALVLDDVGGDAGTIKLEGEVWTARAFDEDEVIPAGTRVQVVEIRGATALVVP